MPNHGTLLRYGKGWIGEIVRPGGGEPVALRGRDADDGAIVLRGEGADRAWGGQVSVDRASYELTRAEQRIVGPAWWQRADRVLVLAAPGQARGTTHAPVDTAELFAA